MEFCNCGEKLTNMSEIENGECEYCDGTCDRPTDETNASNYQPDSVEMAEMAEMVEMFGEMADDDILPDSVRIMCEPCADNVERGMAPVYGCPECDSY